MINKTGDDLLGCLMEDPDANRVAWEEIPDGEQKRLIAWYDGHINQGKQFLTHYSTVETSSGPKYFDWNDYPYKR